MIFSSKEDFFAYCKRHGPLIILITLLIAWNAVFIYLRLARYLTFHYPGWDLGFFDQVIWLMSHGEVAATVLHRNLFVDHFSPIFYLFVPFYWAGIGMYTLLISYPVMISLGTIPLYRLTKRVSSNKWLPLLAPLVFLLHPAIINMTLNGFYTSVLAIPLGLFMLYYIEKKSWWFILFLGLILSLREEFFLIALCAGAVLFIMKRDWKKGAVSILLGGLFYYGVFHLYFPYFKGPLHKIEYYYGWLGSSIPEVIKAMFVQPIVIIKELISMERILYVIQILVPLSFVFIFGPLLTALGLGFVIINLLASTPERFNIGLYYAAAAYPFLFAGLIYGIKHIISFRSRSLRIGLITMIVCIAIASSVVWSRAPWGLEYEGTRYLYTEWSRAERMQSVLAHIPDDASVCAQSDIVPHLSQRAKIENYPRCYQKNIDYYIYDRRGNSYPAQPNSISDAISEFIKKDEYGLVAYDDYIYLFQRGAAGLDVETLYRTEQFPAQTLEILLNNDTIKLIGYDIEPGTTVVAGTEITLSLFWSAVEPIEDDLYIFVHIDKSHGGQLQRINLDHPPCDGALTMTNWKLGEVYLDTFQKVIPAAQEEGSYKIYIGLYNSKGSQPGYLIDTLTITKP